MTHTSQDDKALTQNSEEEVIEDNFINEDSPQVKSCNDFFWFSIFYCFVKCRVMAEEWDCVLKMFWKDADVLEQEKILMKEIKTRVRKSNLIIIIII